MARTSDPAKATQWQRRLERFDASSLSVARFCQREKVSVASFYHWRKKLADRTNRDPAPLPNGAPRAAFRPVTVVAATPTMTVHLPGGARLEFPGRSAPRLVSSTTGTAGPAPERRSTVRSEEARGWGQDGI